jgi:N-acetylmuramoyl-L-alanine amidase
VDVVSYSFPVVVPDLRSSRLVAVVVVVVLLFGGVFAWRLRADREAAAAGSPASTFAPDSGGAMVGYLVTAAGAILSESEGGQGRTVAPGIVFPVTAAGSSGFQVFDNCNRPGWVGADEVEPGLVPIERNRRLEESVFVIDPGHGLPDLGAVGPSGLTEAEVNIDVSARIVDLLRSPHDIDWATGAVTPGTTVPSVAAAILTRAPDGPNGGDYELGLTFRAMLANAVDATALVSIHHNTEPTRNLELPGSSAFVSADNPESPRLGGIIVDELRTAFSRFEADWVGGEGEGLNIRVGADGDDYYTLLGLSEHPAVIVEGAYISNPSEEALIMTDVFRQAYAEGVYRALVRFVTTDDDPIPAPEPELFDVDAPPRSMDDCVVPAP